MHNARLFSKKEKVFFKGEKQGTGRKEGREQDREPEQEKEPEKKSVTTALILLQFPPVGLYDHIQVSFVH